MPDTNDPKRADRAPEQIVRSTTEARRGEIILGRWGRIIWIGSFVLMAMLILVLGLWW
jgi:hypothetical protein